MAGWGGVGAAISGAANDTPVGRGLNSAFLGLPGAAGSAMQGKDPTTGVAASANNFTDQTGLTNSAGKAAQGNLTASQQQQYNTNSGLINSMNVSNQGAVAGQQSNVNAYEQGQNQWTGIANKQMDTNQANTA